MSGHVGDLYRKLDLIEGELPGWISCHDRYGGIRVDESGTLLELQVTTGRDDLADLRRIFASQRLTHLVRHLGVRYVGEHEAEFEALSRSAGDATGLNKTVNGTLGWIFFLDDQLVGMSCYHVLCEQGDCTPSLRNKRVPLADVYCGSGTYMEYAGMLFDYDQLMPGRRLTRLFDLALVKLEYPERFSGTMRPCTNGDVFDLPGLGSAAHVLPRAAYRLIGNASQECQALRFRGVTNCRMDYDGVRYRFKRQLLFGCDDDKPGSEPGDSGAVIVHADSNSVVGLASQRTARYTVANPLFLKPWKVGPSVRVQQSGAIFPGVISL